MSFSVSRKLDLTNLFQGVQNYVGKPPTIEQVVFRVFLGVGAFFLANQCDKSLKNYFLPSEIKGGEASLREGGAHSLVKEVCCSLVLGTAFDFFSSDVLNRVLQVSRFCISFLLGSAAGRSLGFSSNEGERKFSTDMIFGFSWAVCREASLLGLPRKLSFSLLIMADGIISSLIQACPKSGEFLSDKEWYYKASSRGVFQIIAGCTTFTGSSISSFVQKALFNITRSL